MNYFWSFFLATWALGSALIVSSGPLSPKQMRDKTPLNEKQLQRLCWAVAAVWPIVLFIVVFVGRAGDEKREPPEGGLKT